MDIHQLIYELSIGIRLPNPQFCPQQIGTLLKHCFHEKPNERPNFRKIKGHLEAADKNLIAQVTLIDAINKMKDNTMGSLYANIKTGDQNHKKRKSFAKNNETLIGIDKSFPTVEYISLENVDTLGSEQELYHECQGEVHGELRKLRTVEKTYKQFYPASNVLKRFYSYPG